MVSEDGYTLRARPRRGRRRAGDAARSSIDGPDGAPVTAYDEEHEKQLHLIAVRRDFTGYQHVHPTLAADGTWTTDLDLTPGQLAGLRRLQAHRRPGADARHRPRGRRRLRARRPPPAEPRDRHASTATPSTLAGDLVAGEASPLTADRQPRRRAGHRPQPYLGAYGHLVALRDGDLAYLHVHPRGRPTPGPEVPFVAEVPERRPLPPVPRLPARRRRPHRRRSPLRSGRAPADDARGGGAHDH